MNRTGKTSAEAPRRTEEQGGMGKSSTMRQGRAREAKRRGAKKRGEESRPRKNAQGEKEKGALVYKGQGKKGLEKHGKHKENADLPTLTWKRRSGKTGRYREIGEILRERGAAQSRMWEEGGSLPSRR